MALKLGINHPWIACGHDFGRKPPAWAGAPRTDFQAVRADLETFSDLELKVSRHWLLAGGVNYPIGREPRAGVRCTRGRHGEFYRATTGDRPPTIRDTGFVADFDRWLGCAQAASVALVPSLVSFEFFFPRVRQGSVYSNGRGLLALGDEDGSGVDAFFDATLDPLLEAAEARRDAVRAFDLINEPDWVVRGGPLHVRKWNGIWRPMPKFVSARAMDRFILRGVERVVDAGFVASVGFKQGSPRWLSRETVKRLRELGERGDYLHQVHHYPSLSEPHSLPLHSSNLIQPCVVGEFSSARSPKVGLRHWRWRDSPEMKAREEEPDQYLVGRLEEIERRGYPEAWLWSGTSKDEATDFAAIKAQLRTRRHTSTAP